MDALVGVPVALDVALALRVSLDVGVRVRLCVAVELGVALDERVRVLVMDAVRDAVPVELRVVLGVASEAAGGRATPRSCCPSRAAKTADTRAVDASMRYTADALLVYSTNAAPAGVASRRPVSEYTGDSSELRLTVRTTDHSLLAAERRRWTT